MFYLSYLFLELWRQIAKAPDFQSSMDLSTVDPVGGTVTQIVECQLTTQVTLFQQCPTMLAVWSLYIRTETTVSKTNNPISSALSHYLHCFFNYSCAFHMLIKIFAIYSSNDHYVFIAAPSNLFNLSFIFLNFLLYYLLGSEENPFCFNLFIEARISDL